MDTTRGGVMNALYQEAAAYDIDGVEEGAAAFLTGLGVVRGDQAGGLNEDPALHLSGGHGYGRAADPGPL